MGVRRGLGRPAGVPRDWTAGIPGEAEEEEGPARAVPRSCCPSAPGSASLCADTDSLLLVTQDGGWVCLPRLRAALQPAASPCWEVAAGLVPGLFPLFVSGGLTLSCSGQGSGAPKNRPDLPPGVSPFPHATLRATDQRPGQQAGLAIFSEGAPLCGPGVCTPAPRLQRLQQEHHAVPGRTSGSREARFCPVGFIPGPGHTPLPAQPSGMSTGQGQRDRGRLLRLQCWELGGPDPGVSWSRSGRRQGRAHCLGSG